MVLSFSPSTPKLVNFPHFLDSRSWKKHVNTKASQFSTYFGFQKFEKNMSTPKLGNVPHGSKFQSVNTKTSQFLPFFWLARVREKHWEKNMSTPKLVNFPHFLTCTSLRKTCQHQKFEKKRVNTKTSPFSPLFDLHEFEKNMSTPKLVNFHHFLDSRSLRKNMSTPKLVNFHHFFDSRSLRKNMSTPKLVNFHHFWTPGVWEKTCQHQN